MCLSKLLALRRWSKFRKRVIRQTRVLPNKSKYRVDIRLFFVNPACEDLQKIVGSTKGWNDEAKAAYCLSWVQSNIKYVSDKEQFGLEEFWMIPQEILNTRRGDCDDGAILLANLLAAALGKKKSWKVMLATGETKSGLGHMKVLLYSKGEWVALDWMSGEHLAKIWFIWNIEHVYVNLEELETW